MQAGRARFLAHLEQPLRVEAEPPRASQHLRERRKVDRVLPFVVRRAAAVPAAALHFQHPGRAPSSIARRSPATTSPWP